VSLLPTPDAEGGFEVFSAYRPGERRMERGGDFMDVTSVAGGIAFVLGDVSGHGPREAALSASVRAGWRALVGAGMSDPAEWARVLSDSFVEGDPDGRFVTMCAGTWTTGAGLRLVSAGHPTPVLIAEAAEEIQLPVGPALGLATAPGAWVSGTASAQAGDSLLLFSDGLLDARVRPRSSRRHCTDDLVEWLDRHEDEFDGAALDQLLRAFGGADMSLFEDDVALLLLCRTDEEGQRPRRRRRGQRSSNS
jgi:serine phosphatase RsbU (regulator of sigma subunit)